MPKSTLTKIRDKDYAKLKKYSEKHGLLMTEVLSKALSKLESKKLESKEKDFCTCDECEEKIPEDASFCPYCGVEFEDEDEDEED